MKKSHLITADLIDQIAWCQQAPAIPTKDDPTKTWKMKAFEDLTNKLSRTYSDMPLPAKQGIDFEKKLYDMASKKLFKGSDEFKTLVEFISHSHMVYDYKISKEVGIKDFNCFLYGKVDVFAKDQIIDIKTTKEFKRANYLKKFQHKLYCHITGIHQFTYAVAEWDVHPKIKKVHFVPVVFDDPQKLQLEVENEILLAFEFLKEMELWEIYRDKYCKY